MHVDSAPEKDGWNSKERLDGQVTRGWEGLGAALRRVDLIGFLKGGSLSGTRLSLSPSSMPTSAQYQSLTRRKGSATAHDPYAFYYDDGLVDRQTISRLTIVHVGTDDAEHPHSTTAPSSPPHVSPLTSYLDHELT